MESLVYVHVHVLCSVEVVVRGVLGLMSPRRAIERVDKYTDADEVAVIRSAVDEAGVERRHDGLPGCARSAKT